MHKVIIDDALTLGALSRIAKAKRARAVDVVRALVAHADPEGATLGGARAEPMEVDRDVMARAAAALVGLMGEGRFLAADVLRTLGGAPATRRAPLLAALEEGGVDVEKLEPRRLGIWLRSVAGLDAGGLRVRRVRETRDGTAVWRVEREGGDGPVDAGAGGAAVAGG